MSFSDKCFQYIVKILPHVVTKMIVGAKSGFGRDSSKALVDRRQRNSHFICRFCFVFTPFFFLFSVLSPPTIFFEWIAYKITCHILSQSGKSKNQSYRFPALIAGWRVFSFRCDWLISLKLLNQMWLAQSSFTYVFGQQTESESAIEVAAKLQNF